MEGTIGMEGEQAADREVDACFIDLFRRERGDRPRSIRRATSFTLSRASSLFPQIESRSNSVTFEFPETDTSKPVSPILSYECILPTLGIPGLKNANNQGIKRISTETVSALLQGEYDDHFSTLSIIDCRFDFEYQAGHIQGAVSINDPFQLVQELLQEPKGGTNTCIVFHCEFSKHRAPKLCQLLRDLDRKMHDYQEYPHVYYPELYVMDGGYKEFYGRFPELCEPLGYCPMNAEENVQECKRAWMELKRSWRRFKASKSRCKSAFPLENVSTSIFPKDPKESAIRPFTLD